MKKIFSLLVLTLLVSGLSIAQENNVDEDTRMVKKIFDEVLVNGQTYQDLEHLCHEIGPRLSGSQASLDALDWTEQLMRNMGFDKVYRQEVMVPHWERGAKEAVKIIDFGKDINLSVLAIGGSVATPDEGIMAQVVEVQSLDEVDELGREGVEGKIVFYNRGIDPRHINTGAGYGGAVDQRKSGASRAAKYGALGIVIRSVTTATDDVPHTGTLSYEEGIEQIPAAALGIQSSDKLSAALKENSKLRLYMKLNCVWHEDAKSYNVIGELTGSEFPEQIVTVGGHLDSWDVGHGAHDDGAGCLHSIHALKTLKDLGIQPKHTIRAVMFINEENGTRGGKKYAELAKENEERHLIAIESDAGGFSPRGFGVTADDAIIDKMRGWLKHFDINTISYISKGGGGVDIRPLHNTLGTPMVGLIVDSQRAFDIHHSPIDTFDKVSRRELELGTASLAAFIYLIDKHGLE